MCESLFVGALALKIAGVVSMFQKVHSVRLLGKFMHTLQSFKQYLK